MSDKSIDPMNVFFEDERTAMFIDGANLYAASRNLGFDVDYAELLQQFQDRTKLVAAHYYSAIVESDDYSPLKPLTDWLAYNGYNLVTKSTKEFIDPAGRRRVKGNMDVEIAVDILTLAPKIEHAVLFSGDSDFRYLVEAVQRQGVKVTVISTVKSQPPMIADDLRRQANRFIDLQDIANLFTRRQTDARKGRFEPANVGGLSIGAVS